MTATTPGRPPGRHPAGDPSPAPLAVVVVPDLVRPDPGEEVQPPDGAVLTHRLAAAVGDPGAVVTVPLAQAETTLGATAGGPRVVVAPFCSTRGRGSGSSAAGRLRQLVHAVHPCPVVAWVPTGDVRAARMALWAGVADYAAPHVTADQLLRLLQAALRSGDLTQVARTERLWRTVVSRVSDGVLIVGRDGRLRVVTPAASDFFEPAPVPATADDLLLLVHPDDRPAATSAFALWRSGSTAPVELRIAGRDGWRRCELVGLDLHDDPAVTGTVLTLRDVTDRREAQERLVRQADRDPLTGLAGRRVFFDAVALAVAGRERGGAVLALVDTDGLVQVNERHGHDVGDRLLVQMARHLQAAAGGALVARVDGGSFGVLWTTASGADALALGQRLVGAAVAVDTGRPDGPAPARLAARVGVATAAADGPELLARADLALEEARRRCPQAVVAFDEALAQRIGRNRRLRADLHDVVARGELDVHYGPIVALPSEDLIRFEARVRWHHPRLGLLDASQFLHLAEQTGDVVPIGTWVLHRACDQVARWHRARPDVPVGVTVNVSPRLVATPGFATRVTGMLHACALAASSLCLRIDAGVPPDELDALASVLRQLRAAGVRLTARNLASEPMMAVLRRAPLDHVTLDRRSVAGLGVDPVDTALVEALVGLGNTLGLVVVAEGVTTPEQRDLLVALGCGAAQGPLWSDPVPTHTATAVIAAAAHPAAGAGPWSPAWQPLRRPDPGAPGQAPTSRAGHAPDATRPVIAYLAHELRNPLQTVQSFVELLRDRIGDDAAPSDDADSGPEALAGIERGLSRLERLVGSLRDVTDIQDRSLSLHRATADVADLVRRLVADQAGALAGRPVTVHADGPATAVVDADRVAQVLTNLLANAAKFSPPGAPIDISVDGAATAVAVHVVDRGPGIPARQALDVFRPFVTFDASRRGMGLGLFLARGIAEAHGGELRYRRASTGGAEFVLVLPRGTGAPVPAAPAPSLASPEPRRAGASPDQASTGIPDDRAAGAGHAGGARHAGGEGRGGTDHSAAAPTTERAGPLADVALGGDADALRAVLRATERLLAVESVERAVGVAIDLVVELGGGVVVEGDPAPPGHTVPVDLSLGTPPGLWAVVDPVSSARIRIEAVLPAFVAVARTAAQRLRRSTLPADVDPATGFVRGAAVAAVVDAATGGDVLLVARVGPERGAAVSLARLMRANAPAGRCLVLDAPPGGPVTPAVDGPDGPCTDLAVLLPAADAAALLDATVAHLAHTEAAGHGPTVAWVAIGPRAAPDGPAALERCRRAIDGQRGGTVRAA